jgi:ABC-type transport system, involved in lipoprotein release, permease component
MSWLPLFVRFFLRPLRQEPVRTALTAFAIALGVGVVLAIDLAGTSAAGSFRASLEALAGSADFEVTGIGGVPPEVLARLATVPLPIKVTPRIEDYARVESTGETVPLIGVDWVASAPAGGGEGTSFAGKGVWVGPRLASKKGARLRLLVNDLSVEYVVRGILSETPGAGEAGNVIVMDLAEADQALGRQGRLDRILIDVPESGELEHWESQLRSELPEGLSLERFGARTEENRRMLAAFRWNLRILSYIALVVGAFLIYNTISVSVVRRRAEIGIVRALGATRRGILVAFLGEAALLGAIGAVPGLVLGRLMAEGAVQLVAGTVGSLYVSSTPAPIELTPASALLSLCAGIGVALASSLGPAREASAVPPVEAMARGRVDYHSRINARRNLTLAVLLALAGTLAAWLPPVAGKPLFGYLAALVLIASASLAIPALVSAVSRGASALARRLLGVEAFMASRGLAASLHRTSVLVGALATAIAMVVSVGVMVGSFRETVLLWMDDQLRADLYVRPAGAGSADRHPVMSPEVPDLIEKVPGVAAVDRFRALRISYHGLPATLGAGETQVALRFGRTRFLSGTREEALSRLPGGDSVIVSEPFANKHKVGKGDFVELALGGTTRRFEILGVYYDYANERGTIMMDRSTLLKYLPDPSPSSVAVYLEPERDIETVRAELERAVAGRRVLITSNRALRREAIRIFDRTFAITYALEAVAVAVAVMGIGGALLALVVDRRREFGLLRFLGASAGQVRQLILFEAGLLGLLANLAGFVLGAALSLVLIYVINKQSFGWTIQFHWPVAVLLAALSLIDAATIAAGLYPARVAARLRPVEVIHEE